MKNTKIDFQKVLGLKHEIGGFVSRITSPKGIKKVEDNRTSYEFKTTTAGYKQDNLISVNHAGIFQVCDICHWKYIEELQWNFYLVVVEEDGNAYPVGEYLDSPNTLWVKEAMPIVKAFFNGDELEEIELTKQPKQKNKPFDRSYSSQHTENTGREVVAKQKTAPKKIQKAAPSDDIDEEDTYKPDPSKRKKRTGTNGRPQEKKPLEYGQARLMTFTGMIIGVYEITRHNKKYIEVNTTKGLIKFSKEDGKQVDAEKPKYANKIEWNLEKEDK